VNVQEGNDEVDFSKIGLEEALKILQVCCAGCGCAQGIQPSRSQLRLPPRNVAR
jgi:hypothetical protein